MKTQTQVTDNKMLNVKATLAKSGKQIEGPRTQAGKTGPMELNVKAFLAKSELFNLNKF